MHHRPPESLVELLARLQLVDITAWNAVGPYVRTLSADLPVFESVWIDALRQARFLTQFQAATLHAGRGDTLLVDRYVLYERLDDCYYADAFRARELDSDVDIRLTQFTFDERDAAGVGTSLRKLLAVHGKLRPGSNSIVTQAGVSGSVAWAVGPWQNGISAAAWILRHGRFDPAIVLEIARAMVDALAELESAGLCHADISAYSLLLLDDGSVMLPHAGLRAIARPYEGFAKLDIRAEACDGLSPDRVADGGPPTTASDMFACGCLWWHLLCGRGAFGGGDSLSRLKIAHEAKIAPVTQWATDVPVLLIDAINACTHRHPTDRPASFKELCKQLGSPTYRGKQQISRIVSQRAGSNVLRPATSNRRRRRLSPSRIGTIAGTAAIAIVALVWPIWSSMTKRASSLVAVKPQSAIVPTKSSNDLSHIAGKSPTQSQPDLIADAAVSQASYLQPATTSDIVLSSSSPTLCSAIALRPGCRVRAAPGERAKILVPPEGWSVACERICFINIDFAFAPKTNEQGNSLDWHASGGPIVACLLDLHGDQVEFQGCTFQADNCGLFGDTSIEAMAILWKPAWQSQDSALALPSGRLRIKNSVFINAGAGISIMRHGAAIIEMNNVLYSRGGPCIAIRQLPAVDEPTQISLFAVTLRDSNALLSIYNSEPTKSAGGLSVDATSCVFANQPSNSLVVIGGTGAADDVLRSLKWTGQGSLLASKTPFARARSADGTLRPVDDSVANVAGLVRDDVEFAGPVSGGIANCRVVGWHAPLQSPDAPGAVVEQLPKLP